MIKIIKKYKYAIGLVFMCSLVLSLPLAVQSGWTYFYWFIIGDLIGFAMGAALFGGLLIDLTGD